MVGVVYGIHPIYSSGTGENCTVRAYTFYPDSTHKGLAASTPASTCGSVGAAGALNYDSADRPTTDAAGTYTNDVFGRATTSRPATPSVPPNTQQQRQHGDS